jgi:hypothetical protein
MDSANGQSFFAINFLRYKFPSSKWYPYPFFYRLEGARVLDEPSTMHGREFQLTNPYLFVPSETFLFFVILKVHAGYSGPASMCISLHAGCSGPASVYF